MDLESVLEPILAELNQRRIGDRFEPRPNDAKYYRHILDLLLQMPKRDFATDLRQGLPFLLQRSASTPDNEIRGPLCWVKTGPNHFEDRRAETGEPCLYWNGKGYELRPYPGVMQQWTDEFTSVAERICESLRSIKDRPLTVLEIGSGTGAFTFHLVDAMRRMNIGPVRLVNLEMDVNALAFSLYFSRRHNIDVEHVLVDMASCLANSADLDALRGRVRIDESALVVITHSALHPFYTDEQYDRLFPIMINDLGARYGFHLERRGFRTLGYANMLTKLPPPFEPWIKEDFTEWPSDPFYQLEDNADRWGITITENVDLYPHFPLRSFPSFLSWRSNK